MKIIKKTSLIIILAILTACSQKPVEIHYGSDECAYCKMMITEERFASQVITETGKSITFDSIECMARYSGEHKKELESAKRWVNDFSNPGNWLNVENATLIKSEVINSPMGSSLLAVENEESAKKHMADYPGRPVAWQRIVK